MASSRRTYDTDTITLRTVFAKYSNNNSNIPAMQTLTSDGAGGTFWAIPSSLGILPAFNKVQTTAGTFTADLSYNTFGLYAGEGQGMYRTGSNLNLFSKAFTEFDVSGENTISAYSNYTLHNHVKLAGQGAISIRGDPATNTIFINGPASQFISTPTFGFSQLKFIDGVSSLTADTQKLFGNYFTADSASTLVSFAGQSDLRLSTNVTTNTVMFSISTFTSKGYLDISANTYGLGQSVSTIGAGVGVCQSSLSTFSSVINTVLYDNLNSSILALAISTGAEFYLLSGQINARATIIQLNDDIGFVNSNIVSSTRGVATWISTLNLPVSTYTLSGSSATTPQLLGKMTFPYAGNYQIHRKAAFTKVTGGTGAQSYGTLILNTVASLPSFPAPGSDLAGLPSIQGIQNGGSTFTTLVSGLSIDSTDLSRNLYYYDAAGGAYIASLMLDKPTVRYMP